MKDHNTIKIKKILINNNKLFLTSLNNINCKIVLDESSQYVIMGIVIQVNAKT